MINDKKNKRKALLCFGYSILGGILCAIYGFKFSKFQISEIFLLIVAGLVVGFIYGLVCSWQKKMRDIMHSGDYEYISNFKLFGMPLIHICLKSEESRKPARGVIAIGGIAMGVVSIGGFAIGVVSIGGGSVGLISFGGVSLGLLVAMGGLAAGFIASGGVAIGQFVTGGLAYVLQL